MTGTNTRHPDRRDFLKHLALGAAAGGAYLGFGGLSAAWGQPGRRGLLDAAARLPQQRPFHMLVIGDSIMWGQGLREENKFSTLVARWIESQLSGVQVLTSRWAHSGAVIQPDDREDRKKGTPGEVPNAYPSITAQVSTAVAAISPRYPVDLVLMDGGINDVSVWAILTTDPTISDKLAWIRRLTRERCTDRMKLLLPLVLGKFPSAKVVVTSYFPIVSPESDPRSLAELLAVLDVSRVTSAVTPLLRTTLGVQAQLFHEEYVAGVGPVVLNAEPLGRIVTAATSSAPPNPVDVGQVSGTGLASGRRTAFALVPFKPENSYGAPKSWLWTAEQADQVYAQRRAQCRAAGVSNALNPKCYKAAMGHPNVEGAREYALAIQREIEQFLPEWRQALAPRPMPQLAVRMEPQPVFGEPSRVTVYAEDAETRTPVNATVVVEAVNNIGTPSVARYPANAPFTHTFACTRPLWEPAGVPDRAARMVCDQVRVIARGYAEAIVTLDTPAPRRRP
jgi:lysophospholipase L1-like esterase